MVALLPIGGTRESVAQREELEDEVGEGMEDSDYDRLCPFTGRTRIDLTCTSAASDSATGPVSRSIFTVADMPSARRGIANCMKLTVGS